MLPFPTHILQALMCEDLGFPCLKSSVTLTLLLWSSWKPISFVTSFLVCTIAVPIALQIQLYLHLHFEWGLSIWKFKFLDNSIFCQCWLPPTTSGPRLIDVWLLTSWCLVEKTYAEGGCEQCTWSSFSHEWCNSQKQEVEHSLKGQAEIGYRINTGMVSTLNMNPALLFSGCMIWTNILECLCVLTL